MGLAEISFAHARQRIQLPKPSEGWVPRPHNQRSSSTNDASKLRTEAHMFGSKAKSKVLEALDTGEPLSMKNLFERIKQTPDLAGLLHWEKTTDVRVPRSPELGEKRPTKRQKPELDDKNIIASKTEVLSYSDNCLVRSNDGCWSVSRRLATPALEDGYEETDIDESPRRPRFEFSSMDIPSSSSYMYEDEDDSWQPQIESWSSGSFRLRSNSDKHIPNAIEEGPRIISSSSPTGAEDKNRRAILPSSDNVTRHDVDDHGLPRIIRLMPSQNDTPVYGTLFELEDPWRAIGQILGVEAQDHDEVELDAGRVLDSEITGDHDSRRQSSDWSRSMMDIDSEIDEQWKVCQSPRSEDGSTVLQQEEMLDVFPMKYHHARDSRPIDSPYSIKDDFEPSPPDDSATYAFEVEQLQIAASRAPSDYLALPGSPQAIQADADRSSSQSFAIEELEWVDGNYLGPALFGFEHELSSSDEECALFL
ncbi:hypothetical protein FA15DRAFT_754000 [Coprinopsis marcescibilis]|uniref:Uncharacterized protein n=1 Tax=Coprinopsis marcescibilis TaxID=230819 RepID=A0A5C3LH06_COPMA|nr:hypothetical protein FA15DRAFT_754000 [Coprinopsis marcescibilis]